MPVSVLLKKGNKECKLFFFPISGLPKTRNTLLILLTFWSKIDGITSWCLWAIFPESNQERWMACFFSSPGIIRLGLRDLCFAILHYWHLFFQKSHIGSSWCRTLFSKSNHQQWMSCISLSPNDKIRFSLLIPYSPTPFAYILSKCEYDASILSNVLLKKQWTGWPCPLLPSLLIL
jgi:hypothetical protein